jgi:hypothetical protein
MNFSKKDVQESAPKGMFEARESALMAEYNVSAPAPETAPVLGFK